MRALGSARDARILQGFFKTGPGEYGEGDVFLGVRVPAIRGLVKDLADLPPGEALRLLASPFHEARLLGLLCWVRLYRAGPEPLRAEVYAAYLANTGRINNWDLVDLSAPEIVGAHLLNRSRRPLYRLARSRKLWERRIAIVATHRFIRAGSFDDTLRIAELLLRDDHDLIHKASGWMLREAGKRNESVLRGFLDRHHRVMPRTMLRYSIERLPPADRRRYMRLEP